MQGLAEGVQSMSRDKTSPYYKVVLKQPDDTTVVETKQFYIGKLAMAYARCWPQYNVYVFEKGKMVLALPSSRTSS